MQLLLKRAFIYQNNHFRRGDLRVCNGLIAKCGPSISEDKYDRVLDCTDMYVFPGLADVHVHLREPGFSYKETISSGTQAAAAGGFTAVCSMPNLKPAPDSPEHLQEELNLIARDAIIPVYPYACLTAGGTGRGSMIDYATLSKKCVAFSDDGKGIQSGAEMEKIMSAVKTTGKIIAAHCEDESLLAGGYIHNGRYASVHKHKGISSESEWIQVQRDLELVRKTGCPYHICHISTKESANLLRKAKKEGLPVSGETAPHYLLLCDDDLQEDGRFRMNPPLRSAEDRQALLEAVCDGTIEILATDHAPHSLEEKSKGLAGSAFGIVGLETALSANWTALVVSGLIKPERLAELMSVIPRKRFSLPEAEMSIGAKADLCIFDPRCKYLVDPDSFRSKGRSTPFAGMSLWGKVMLTVWHDNIVFEAEEWK